MELALVDQLALSWSGGWEAQVPATASGGFWTPSLSRSTGVNEFPSRGRDGGIAVLNDSAPISNTCAFGRVAHPGIERIFEGVCCIDPCCARAHAR
ncbi:hypothetical protein [Streptomyces triticiradicis]|uniref:Uncharacterized protein n=1 Tax=Streptomyces triticiradicis TaxID=2651189 RepID=A0A7J5D931_9ACTN|nr:hypothetical protein [Streptomyces triticiradicis]KAB1982861.1 hypothetical protein F8144_30170 [Streptomyces triticiradicis]